MNQCTLKKAGKKRLAVITGILMFFLMGNTVFAGEILSDGENAEVREESGAQNDWSDWETEDKMNGVPILEPVYCGMILRDNDVGNSGQYTDLYGTSISACGEKGITKIFISGRLNSREDSDTARSLTYLYEQFKDDPKVWIIYMDEDSATYDKDALLALVNENTGAGYLPADILNKVYFLKSWQFSEYDENFSNDVRALMALRGIPDADKRSFYFGYPRLRVIDENNKVVYMATCCFGAALEPLATWVENPTEYKNPFGTTGETQKDPSKEEKPEEPSIGETPSDPSAVTPAYQPKNDVEAFVYRLYVHALNREPDEAGLNDWTNKLINKERSGSEVAVGFFFSAEMNNRNLSDEDFVELLYQVMMDRNSEEEGKAYWVAMLNSGVSRMGVFNGFAGSLEFQNICNAYGIDRGTPVAGQGRDRNYGVTRFVFRLYEKALGRDFDEEGLNDWCSRIVDGTWSVTDVSTTGFFHSQEFLNKNLSNEEYVKVLYRTFLDREYDEAGLNDWVSQLDSGIKSRDDVLMGFSYSPEFAGLMKEYGL